MGLSMRKWVHFFLAIIMLILTSTVVFAEAHALQLNGIDGQKHALNEYIGHGKWVVVNVWATACPYCRHELYDLSNFHNAHKEKEAVVIGLTIDWPSFEYPDKGYLADFASGYFIDYPLLIVNGEVASQVIGKSVDMVPISFFYNPEGQLVHRINGMVTEQMLKDVIKQKPSKYRTDWAKEVPPEYQPKQK